MQCRALDQKRYFRSKGIVVQEFDVWRVPFCTNMLRAAQVAFQAISGHCMDDLQIWCNNNLGVVYLATAPGLPQVVRSDSYSTLIDGEGDVTWQILTLIHCGYLSR
ncbi:hypothetical protein [Janthinobacterium tructae]|uniref:hypothetical protein n=1 Tax=Janthinobacterium tructae TaxID=2590869 RepID=UPI00196ABCDF|nr:hypothetical protein [Janthinobacterium tructae]